MFISSGLYTFVYDQLFLFFSSSIIQDILKYFSLDHQPGRKNIIIRDELIAFYL